MSKNESNKANSTKSTGPKTKAGKNNSKSNAFKHGLFSGELIIPKGTETDYKWLRESLYKQLAPSTPLQLIACDGVFCCCWRCKLATRKEMMHLKIHFEPPPEEDPTDPLPDAGLMQWYASSPQSLRAARRFLLELHQDIETNWGIHLEEKRDSIIKMFGPVFYDLLRTWTPSLGREAVLLADHLVEHAKMFHRPLPDPPEEVQKLHKDKDLIPDPLLISQMQIKLIDIQCEFMATLERTYRLKTTFSETQAGGATDFSSRYFTTATRDLHRAVNWFLEVREKGL